MRGLGEALRNGVRAVSTACAHRVQVLLTDCLTNLVSLREYAFRLSVMIEKEIYSLFILVSMGA